MKKLLLPAFLLGQLSVVSAQTTISAANFNPVIGDNISGYFSDSLSGSGGSGTGQVWDYQSLTPNTSAYNFTYQAPAGGNTAASFGSANLRIDDRYYTADLLGLKFLGYGSPGGNGNKIETPYYTYRFPLSYGTAYSESKFTRRYDIRTGMSDTLKGITLLNVVGEGTLKLPSGTFTNVLKLIRTEVDTEIYRGNIISTLKKVTTEWLYPGIHDPILTNLITEKINTGAAMVRTGSAAFTGRSPLALNEIVKAGYNFIQYPNPVAGQLNISMDLAANADVSIHILSLTGQLVLQGKSQSVPAGKNKMIRVATSSLAPGIYLTDAVISGVHIYQQFVKQ